MEKTDYRLDDLFINGQGSSMASAYERVQRMKEGIGSGAYTQEDLDAAKYVNELSLLRNLNSGIHLPYIDYSRDVENGMQVTMTSGQAAHGLGYDYVPVPKHWSPYGDSWVYDWGEGFGYWYPRIATGLAGAYISGLAFVGASASMGSVTLSGAKLYATGRVIANTPWLIDVATDKDPLSRLQTEGPWLVLREAAPWAIYKTATSLLTRYEPWIKQNMKIFIRDLQGTPQRLIHLDKQTIGEWHWNSAYFKELDHLAFEKSYTDLYMLYNAENLYSKTLD